MTENIKHHLGTWIQILPERAGISQEELGHLLDLHRIYVRSIEQGERNPFTLSQMKIADALLVSVKVLFDD